MFVILQAQIISAKNWVMSVPKKTVSAADMQEEWIEVQAAQRDPARFRPLYVRYYEPIFRFIYRRTDDEDLAADLCSQVFLKALQRIQDYEYRGVPFSAWLYRIASNEVSQHYRNNPQDRTVSVEEVRLGDLAEDVFEDEYEHLQKFLGLALNQLNEKDLQLIEMRFFEQRPFKEIAEILEVTESNAKVKTYRILEKLKHHLRSHTERGS